MSTVPSFPNHMLAITCVGEPALQDDELVHHGLIPSASTTCVFLSAKQVAILLPRGHNALHMIEETQSFCINVLPYNMVHENTYTEQHKKMYVDNILSCGQEVASCEFIPAYRLKEAAASVECSVDNIVKVGEYVQVISSVVYTHHDLGLTGTLLPMDLSRQPQEVRGQ